MTRANGIDFSYWAHEYTHIESLDPISIEFVIHRTNHGIAEDLRFRAHTEASVKVPVRESYYFFEMISPWYTQWELATELNRSAGLVNQWVDAEEHANINVIGPKMFRAVSESLRYNKQEFPEGGLYCNLDFLFQYEAWLDTGVGHEWLDQFALWIANPDHDRTIDYFIDGNGEPSWRVWRGGRWVGIKRKPGNWTYWQTGFSGDPTRYGIVGKKAVDENVFNGTRTELLKLRGKSVLVENVKRGLEKSRRRFAGKRILAQ